MEGGAPILKLGGPENVSFCSTLRVQTRRRYGTENRPRVLEAPGSTGQAFKAEQHRWDRGGRPAEQ